MTPPRAPYRLWLWALAALLALWGAWHAVVSPVGLMARAEWAADDWRSQLLAPTAAVDDIVIVDIDDASLAALGRWPWPRSRLALLLDELFARQRVVAVGIDFLFAEPDEGPLPALRAAAQGDPLLANRMPEWEITLNPDARLALALSNRDVVLGYYLTQDRGGSRSGALPAALVPPPPATALLPTWNGWATNTALLAHAAPGAGFFNAWPDADGVVRSAPAVAWLDGESARPLRLDEHGRLRVPFRAGAGGPVGGAFQYVSAGTLLAGAVAPGTLAGKVVLIGTSAPALADLRPTPPNPALPGVEVHANLLAGILSGDAPQRPDWAPGYEVLLTGALLLAVTALFGGLAPGPALGASTLLLAAVVGANLAAHRFAQLVLPLATPLLLAGVLASISAAAAAVAENQRRRALVHLFTRYMPPERAASLVTQAADSPLEAHNAELTVLFCDLRGFTTLAEGLPPQELRELLNAFLTTATQIIHGHQGTLDKFIGDAVMAFWGAPLPQADHAARAVTAAVALARAEQPLNAALRAQGLPPVRFGIGLATGVACVGDLGSRERSSYTAVGDTVNLAARIEALTREHDLPLLVDAATREAAGDLPGLAWRAVAEAPVRGRQRSVTLFTAAWHAPQSGTDTSPGALEQSPP